MSVGHLNAWDWVGCKPIKRKRIFPMGLHPNEYQIKLDGVQGGIYHYKFSLFRLTSTHYKAVYHWSFVRGIHRWPMDYPKKWPVMRKVFPCQEVIMWIASPILWITRNCVWNSDGTKITHGVTLLNTILSVKYICFPFWNSSRWAPYF